MENDHNHTYMNGDNNMSIRTTVHTSSLSSLLFDQNDECTIINMNNDFSNSYINYNDMNQYQYQNQQLSWDSFPTIITAQDYCKEEQSESIENNMNDVEMYDNNNNNNSIESNCDVLQNTTSSDIIINTKKRKINLDWCVSLSLLLDKYHHKKTNNNYNEEQIEQPVISATTNVINCNNNNNNNINHVYYWNINNNNDDNTEIPDFIETSSDDDDDNSTTDYDDIDIVSKIDTTSILDNNYYNNNYTNNNNNKRHVHFANVQVREYNITLGDHPLADAYPLTLDWLYNKDNDIMYNIDEYDNKRIIDYYYKYYNNNDEDDDDYYNDYHHQDTKKSCSRMNIQRLDVMERRSKLSQFMGITVDKLDIMERDRKKNILLLNK